MPGTGTLLLFAAATIALLVVPGPSVAYVVARSLEHGRAAGLVSMLGLETGALLHAAAAAGGLTAVVATSPWALPVLKYSGAGYLIALGILQLRRRSALSSEDGSSGGTTHVRLFRHGVLVDVLNPKTGLFFLAFLPQFVDPARGAVPIQVGVLGASFVVLAAVVDGTYAVLAGSLRGRLTRSAASRRRVAQGTAGMYVGLGSLAALV